jgi:hypothetical protein
VDMDGPVIVQRAFQFDAGSNDGIDLFGGHKGELLICPYYNGLVPYNSSGAKTSVLARSPNFCYGTSSF